MTDTQKIKVARIASGSYFWMATIVFFLQSKGLTLTQVLTLISIYTITNAICEYPTGVVADFFSQRISLLIGNLFVVFGMLGVLFSGGFAYYAVVMVVIGIGRAFESGSDVAVLHNVSSDFVHDLKRNNSNRIIWLAISISFGSFIAKYIPSAPYFLSAAASFTAFVLTLFIHETKTTNVSTNIFQKANEGFRYVWGKKKLLYLLLFGGLTGTFFACIKWFYNPYFESLNIDIAFWGILITFFTLINAVGIRYYSPKVNQYIALVTLVGLLVLSSFVSLPVLSVFGMISIHIMKGFIDTQNDIALNKELINSIRASVLSLKSLITMLGSTLYLFVAGYIIQATSLTMLLIYTALVIGVLGTLLTRLSQKS